MAGSSPPDDAASDGLIVQLPTTPGAEWCWWRVTGGALAGDHIFSSGDDAPWGDLSDAARIVALVPSSDAPVRIRPRGTMPLAQALAAARLEGGGLGHDLHSVAAAQGDAILVASAANSAMDLWLAELAAAGLEPQVLVPTALVLPDPGAGTVVAELAGQPLARTAEAAFAGEAELVAALSPGEPQNLTGAALDAALIAAWRAPPLNLRQGIYAPRRVSFFRLPDWAQLARMAAVALLLVFLILAVETVKLNRDAAVREETALAAVQKRFPAAVDLATAQSLASGELARRGLGGGSFAAPAAAVLAAVRPLPSLRLRDLGYAGDGTLRFTAAAPTADEVNRLLTDLQEQGWQVTVPPQLAPDPTGATVAAITVRAP